MSTVVQHWRLALRKPPTLRLDVRALVPTVLSGQDPDAISRMTVHHGNEALTVGDFFKVSSDDRGPTDDCADAPSLHLSGDLRRVDRIGWRMDGGCLRVTGHAGDYLACGMTGGRVQVDGDARDFVAAELAGGRVQVDGCVGDFAAASLPGSMEGMRGGTLFIAGDAGDRLGDRMRRGTIWVGGRVGDYAASRLVAGTIAIAGEVGAHPAYGMRRGTLLFLGAHPPLASTFAQTHHDFGVYWTLLRRHLATAGGPFAMLPETPPQRFVGDLAADGQGEVLSLRNAGVSPP